MANFDDHYKSTLNPLTRAMYEKQKEYAAKWPTPKGEFNLAAVIASEEPLRAARGSPNFPKPVIDMTPEDVIAWKP